MKKQVIILLCVIATLIACSKNGDSNNFPNQQLILGKWYFDSVRVLQTKAGKPSPILNYSTPNTDTAKHYEFLTSGVLVSTINGSPINSNYSFKDNNTIKLTSNNESLDEIIQQLDNKALQLNIKRVKTDTTTSSTFYFHK